MLSPICCGVRNRHRTDTSGLAKEGPSRHFHIDARVRSNSAGIIVNTTPPSTHPWPPSPDCGEDDCDLCEYSGGGTGVTDDRLGPASLQALSLIGRHAGGPRTCGVSWRSVS